MHVNTYYDGHVLYGGGGGGGGGSGEGEVVHGRGAHLLVDAPPVPCDLLDRISRRHACRVIARPGPGGGALRSWPEHQSACRATRDRGGVKNR
jgi:hypothetical protein